MNAATPKKLIVILRGGFGGVSTAYHLERLLRRQLAYDQLILALGGPGPTGP